jgi:hypothetical protein
VFYTYSTYCLRPFKPNCVEKTKTQESFVLEKDCENIATLFIHHFPLPNNHWMFLYFHYPSSSLSPLFCDAITTTPHVIRLACSSNDGNHKQAKKRPLTRSIFLVLIL